MGTFHNGPNNVGFSTFLYICLCVASTFVDINKCPGQPQLTQYRCGKFLFDAA